MNYFNDNYWTLVADEENMRKVMELFWRNLAHYPQVVTNLSPQPPEEASADELYESISWYLQNELYLACEDDIPLIPKADGTYSVDYPVPFSGGTGFSISYDIYDDLRVFSASYYTKFTEYTEMMCAVEDRLPPGEYGIATLCSALVDDDEDDRFEIGAVYSRGCEWEGEVPHRGAEFQEEEAESLFNALVEEGTDQLDLKDLAYLFCLANWDPSECDIDVLPFVRFDKYGRERRYIDSGDELRLAKWLTADFAALPEVWPDVLDALSEFPLVADVSSPTRELETNVETLIPGDELILKSEWDSPEFYSASFEVFTVDGKAIGYLSPAGFERYSFVNPILRAICAFVLPHIHVVVHEVEPLFMRRKNYKHPRVLIRLDLDVLDWSELEREIELLIAQAPEERARESRVKGGESA